MEKRGKLEKDAQIMIKMLPPQVEIEKKMQKTNGTKDSQMQMDTKLNKSVGFDYTEHEGRFTKTIANVAAGEEILAERAICAVLMERFSKSHCQHCFARYFGIHYTLFTIILYLFKEKVLIFKSNYIQLS